MALSDKVDLERRIAGASPRDKLRGFLFQRIVDLVKKRVSADAAMRIVAPLRPQGYSAIRSYPVPEFLRLLYAAVDELEPALGVPAAFRALGAASLDGFAITAAGRALFGVLGFHNAARLASQLGLAYSTVASYGTREFHQTSPSGGTIQFRDDVIPPVYNEGVMLRALEIIGYRGKLKHFEKSVNAVDFEVSWAPLEKATH